MRFVLDASVALAWFIDHPTAPFAQRIRNRLRDGEQAVVPALWHLEMANGLIVAERRGILTTADADAANVQIADLLGRAIETIADLVSTRQALDAARAFQLTAYDAVYMDLSMREQLPLATLDKRLRQAATKNKLQVL